MNQPTVKRLDARTTGDWVKNNTNILLMFLLMRIDKSYIPMLELKLM